MKDYGEPSIVWRVNVTLRFVTPAVWRTILIRPDTNLAQLHRYIQAAMEWLDCHLFAFTIDGKEYAIPNPDLGIKVRDARRYRLNRLLSGRSAHLEYVYDFGDRWEHDIQIAGAEEAQSSTDPEPALQRIAEDPAATTAYSRCSRMNEVRIGRSVPGHVLSSTEKNLARE